MESNLEATARRLEEAIEANENLERRYRQLEAHAHAVQEALTKTQRENVQLNAQVQYVKNSAEKGLHQFNELTDLLYKRIDAMADEWEAQIRNRFNLPEKEREELLAIVQPFRPSRLEEASTGQASVS